MELGRSTAVANTYRQNWEHHLGNVERVTPIMISNVTVIFLHTQQPSAQHLVFNVKSLNEIQFQKYSETRLKWNSYEYIFIIVQCE